MLSQFSSSSS